MGEENRRTGEVVKMLYFDDVGSWIIDALPSAVIATDVDGRIVAWNSRAEVTFGRSRSEALGRSVYDVVVSPENRARVEALRTMVLSGERWSGESVVRLGDGSTKKVVSCLAPLRDGAGRVIGVVSAADDVTEMRALAQRSTDLTDHLVLALAAGRLGTWKWDSRTGETTWDRTTEELFGLEPGGFDGTYETWVSLLHPDDREVTLARVADAIASEGSYEVSHRVVWPDGSVHWIQGRGQVTLDPGRSGDRHHWLRRR